MLCSGCIRILSSTQYRQFGNIRSRRTNLRPWDFILSSVLYKVQQLHTNSIQERGEVPLTVCLAKQILISQVHKGALPDKRAADKLAIV